MGVDTQMHIGPYLVIDNKKSETSWTVENACPRKSCKEYGDRTEAKFCPNCGSKNSSVNMTELEDLDAINILDENNLTDYLWEASRCGDQIIKGKTVLTSNFTNPNLDKSRKDFSLDEGGIIDFDNIDIEGEMVWFRNKHKKAIECLEKHFDKKTFQFKYGIVVSFS